MKICFASLRKKINYTDTLEYGMDVFYESFAYFVENNPEHEYSYYNFSFGKKGATRDNDAVKNADVVILAAVQEFVYFVNAMDPRDIEKSQEKIRELYPYLKDKHIVLLTQDRAVDENLILKYTLEDQVTPKTFTTIDEMDFPYCLQTLKYYYMQDKVRFESERNIDFVYWGSDKSKFLEGKKSGDERLGIIRQITKNPDVSSQIIGRWPKSIPVVKKWVPLHEILAYLDGAYSTICFNWIDQTALTGRYHEAIACGIFPFVWKDYDVNNILVWSDFQRISTVEEYYEKLLVIKGSAEFVTKLRKDFVHRIPEEEYYYLTFERLLNEAME